MAKLRRTRNSEKEKVELTEADINAMTLAEMQAYIKENDLKIKEYYNLKAADLKNALKLHLGLLEEEEEEDTEELEEFSEKNSPELKVIDSAVEKVKTLEVNTSNSTVKEPNVRVTMRVDVRSYIGDRWYNLNAGKQYNVPKNVKDILKRAGKLDVN